MTRNYLFLLSIFNILNGFVVYSLNNDDLKVESIEFVAKLIAQMNLTEKINMM